ncbi:MAG: ABC transporter permease, partial [Planctomycetota bacterium]
AVEPIGAGEDLDGAIAAQQERLRLPAERDDAERLIGLVIVDPNAVERSEAVEGEESSGGFGSYEIFVRPKLDARTTQEIRSSLAWSIREERFRAAGVDRERIAELTSVNAPDTQEVTETGTRDAALELGVLMPFVLMFLLFMGVMTGGQYLLTTTVEEKGSRVVEVLLSAVSPMQLMFGKIVGQMFVGLSLLAVYNTIGIVALIVFNQLDLISISTIAWMIVFFLLAYTMFASFMAAIGAAVNELREAQSLMSPVMLTLIVGFYLCFPVSQDPDATYAVVLSFVPPISPLVMLTRIASTSPPPLWQPMLAVGINVIAAYGSVWFAAKVFRVGLLMFGKPPNFATLIKWVRMA